MMKLYICDYLNALRFEPQEPTLALRVFCPGARTFPDPNSWECRNDPVWGQWDNCPQAPFDESKFIAVFGYAFNDICRRPEDLLECPDKIKKNMITPEIAQKIVIDFKLNYRKAQALMTHCYAGASRSVAVAFALSEIFSIDFVPSNERAKHIWKMNSKSGYKGNYLVYQALIDAAEKIQSITPP